MYVEGVNAHLSRIYVQHNMHIGNNILFTARFLLPFIGMRTYIQHAVLSVVVVYKYTFEL